MSIPDDWKNREIKADTVAYETAACNIHGLRHPMTAEGSKGFFHHLGSIIPIRSEKAIIEITNRRAKAILMQINTTIKNGDLEGIDLRDITMNKTNHQLLDFLELMSRTSVIEFLLRERFALLKYSDYLRFVRLKKQPIIEQRYWVDIKDNGERNPGSIEIVDPEYLTLLRHQKNGMVPSEFTQNMEGYCEYLQRTYPETFAFLQRPIPALIPESARQRHTYITGGTGSGKTELMKLLLHSTIEWGKGAVVLIDPHGELSEQVAKWPVFADSDRLVYIDPFLEKGYSPTLNPFDAASGQTAGLMTQQLIAAFEEMLAGQSGSELTVNMSVILDRCIKALFNMKGKTLADLQAFMVDKRNMGLVEQAKRVLPAHDADFFQYQFQQKDFDRTKAALSMRIDRMLSNVRPLFVGQSTFDLEKGINQRKIIIFNLSKGRLGAEASSAFGRFVLAAVQSIALRRAQKENANRVPVHVFVDECQNFIGKSMSVFLTETRKYRVFLTLAQQSVGSGMGSDLREAVLTNPALKLTGTNTRGSYKLIANADKLPMPLLENLLDGEFVGLLRERKKAHAPFVLDPASHLVDDSSAMSDEQWEKVKIQQLARYYVKEGSRDVEPSASGKPNRARPKYEL